MGRGHVRSRPFLTGRGSLLILIILATDNRDEDQLHLPDVFPRLQISTNI